MHATKYTPQLSIFAAFFPADVNYRLAEHAVYMLESHVSVCV